MGRRTWGLIVALVGWVGLAARMLPMWRSPLPFNPDGIHHARWAVMTLATGQLPLHRLATDDLLFPPLLAIAGAVTGIDVFHVAQPVTAVVGTAPAIVGIAVARRITEQRTWEWSETWLAMGLVGILLAVEGLYLHRSMATDEQVVGMLFVPLGAVATWRALRTDRWAWWVVVSVMLIALAPTHNLDATVMAIVLTVLAALVFARSRGRTTRIALTVAIGYWTYIAGYHLLVERFTPARIIQETRLTDVPDQLLAWIILISVGLWWLLNRRPRTQRVIGLVPFALFFALLGVNATETVFPGTPSTDPLLLAGLLPLSIVAGVATWEVPVASRVDAEFPGLVAIIGGVFVLVFLSLTAALTPVYVATAYRATTFLHFPVLIIAGVGTVRIASRCAVKWPIAPARLVRASVVAVVVIAAVASVPIALGGLTVLNYKGTTTPGELAAASFASTHANGTWAADNHIARIAPRGHPNESITAGREGPVYDWLRGGPPPTCLTVLQDSWTTTGAQFYPAPTVRLAQSTYATWVWTQSVIYDGAANDRIRMVFPRGAAGC